MKAIGDVASAHGVRYSERKEAPRSKVVGAPSRPQLLGTARGKVRRIDDLGRVVIPLTPFDKFCIAIHSIVNRAKEE